MKRTIEIDNSTARVWISNNLSKELVTIAYTTLTLKGRELFLYGGAGECIAAFSGIEIFDCRV